MVETLIIRVDASFDIGMGHFMRCLALAQAWLRDGGKVIYAMSDADHLRQRLEELDIGYLDISSAPGCLDDAGEVINYSKKFNASWIILDGYHFKTDYQIFIKDYDFNLLVIDDDGKLDFYCADIILNQNLHASPNLYSNRMDYTELLLGNKYVLLREEFLEWRDWNREVKPVINHLLVTLGGSDKNNYSLKIIRALERLSSLELEINVLVGVSNPHINVLKEFIMGSDLDITILENVRDMPGIMAWADLAFTGGGTTVWEMAFMGLPTIVGATSPVEELLIKGLNKCNLFLNVGRISEVTVSELTLVLSDVMGNRELRCFMSNQGKNLVDGYGVDRVINCMKKK